MKGRLTFYLFVFALVVLDSVLLRSPNLLGKIGLIIYKYSYLRTFPKALLTVTAVVGVAVFIIEFVRWMTGKGVLKRTIALVILTTFALACLLIMIKTFIDFTAWSYSHTGLRFRIGAYLLPAILILVFVYSLFTLPKPHVPFPPSPVMDEKNKDPLDQNAVN
jgi:hypothetical protein